MSYNEYLESGRVHTAKDEQITWDRVRYLRNQVNSHMAWFSKIVEYSENINAERMAANLQVSDLDLSKMAILAKDHKRWSFDSGLPVPSRLVVSGRSTIITHLSELISEIIETLALESDGPEILSSLRRY